MAEKKQNKNNAKLPLLELFYQAGIDPKTKLPLKATKGNTKKLKEDLLIGLRVLDEQNAVNRGRWYNLPNGLSSQELERLLYYRGQLCFFYYEPLKKFYFMPYALDGSIDFYKRFNTVHPIPFSDGTEKGEDLVRLKKQVELLSDLKLTCIYDVVTDEDQITTELLTKSCVLIHDYTKQMSETIIPRQQIQEPLLNVMSEVIPLMRTSLYSGSGTRAIRVQDADQSNSVAEASAQFKDSALQGEPFIPVVGQIDFQDLKNEGFTKPQDYMLALQSLDNLRLSWYGLENGGLFEKKAHELKEEAAINGGPVGLVMQDYVSIRQKFCNIVNSIWGLGIWYEPSENIAETDLNGDGVMYDRDENAGGGDYESNDSEV